MLFELSCLWPSVLCIILYWTSVYEPTAVPLFTPRVYPSSLPNPWFYCHTWVIDINIWISNHQTQGHANSEACDKSVLLSIQFIGLCTFFIKPTKRPMKLFCFDGSTTKWNVHKVNLVQQYEYRAICWYQLVFLDYTCTYAYGRIGIQ